MGFAGTNSSEVGNDLNSSTNEGQGSAGIAGRVRTNTSSSENEEVGSRNLKMNHGSSGGSKFPARMTLRELNMALPEENSSLGSSEDEENYLLWLNDESKRIKATS